MTTNTYARTVEITADSVPLFKLFTCSLVAIDRTGDVVASTLVTERTKEKLHSEIRAYVELQTAFNYKVVAGPVITLGALSSVPYQAVEGSDLIVTREGPSNSVLVLAP